MHDPLVVAFDIRRPWPQRTREPAKTRWRFRGPFWHIAGRRYYWPSMVTVWHVEPGGHDSGEVCKHYRRAQDPDTGTWTTTYLRGWRWHVHHWRIQVQPLQHLRRWALTRCAWCHGRSVKGNPVNVSHSWDDPRGRWWRGEPGLYHGGCSTVRSAHRMCLCDTPDVGLSGHGQCQRCRRWATHSTDPARQRQAALLMDVEPGQAPSPELIAKHRAFGLLIQPRR